MKFENTRVYNFENSFRGMRNPKNSWDLSDSYFNITDNEDGGILKVANAWIQQDHPDWNGHNEEHKKFVELQDEYLNWLITNGILKESKDHDYKEVAYIGPKDMHLAQLLIRSGPEHRKFLRQIFVSVDITAPLYWWKEADTYKVGTVANSTSTMHKLASYPITEECFEMGDYNGDLKPYEGNPICLDTTVKTIWNNLIIDCENLRRCYNETKDIRYWKELVRLLPESWLQTRTITMNYENLLAICSKGQRRNHKLVEWREDFINWARTLPYASQLIFIDEQTSQDFTLS